MRLTTISAITAFVSLFFPSGGRGADVSLGVELDAAGVHGFHLSICKHFHVPEKVFLKVKKHKIPDDELPIVFYLAGKARVAPDVILRLRLGGKSWMHITGRLGLTAEIFHVPVTRVYGPPYGKAYGYFRNKKKAQWGTIHLTDREVTHLVNLKFLSEHHGYKPDKILELREKGDSVAHLHLRIGKHRAAAKKRAHGAAQHDKAAPRTKPRHHPRRTEGRPGGKGGGRRK